MSFTRLCFILVGLSLIGWNIYSLLAPLDPEPVATVSTSEFRYADKVINTEDGEDKNLTDEVSDLRKAVSLLMSRVASLETRLQVQQTAQLSDMSVADQTISLPENEPDEIVLAEREQEQWENYLDFVETGLQQERVDRQWSSMANTEIENVLLNDELGDLSVNDIECRTTLCRIEIVHENSSSMTLFDVLLPQKLAHLLPKSVMSHIQLEDGSTKTVIYLSRDGYELPQPDQQG